MKDVTCRVGDLNGIDNTLRKMALARTTTLQTRRLNASGKQQASSRKGELTRQRILDVALEAFGEAPFREVTTRQISEAANVSLPTLQYYFGDKEGLYKACAGVIVERYRSHTSDAAARGNSALRESANADTARAHLKAVIRALAGFLVGSAEAQRWAQFVARELRDPGPAFEILYEKLWKPGIETIARLIGRIRERPERDSDVRIQALLLISSLLAFQPGRSIALRTMQWTKLGADELTMVLSRLEAQIDAIVRDPVRVTQEAHSELARPRRS